MLNRPVGAAEVRRHGQGVGGPVPPADQTREGEGVLWVERGELCPMTRMGRHVCILPRNMLQMGKTAGTGGVYGVQGSQTALTFYSPVSEGY